MTTSIYSASTTLSTLKVNNVDSVSFSPGGLVGVGTIPSAWSTYQAIDIGTYGTIGVNNSAGNLSLIRNGYFDGVNNVAKTTGTGAIYNLTPTGHRWFMAPSVSAGATFTYVNHMTLDPNGNLSVMNDVSMASQNSGPLAGFRNKIINGDCAIAQRGSTGATTLNSVNYCADRWGGTTTGTAMGFSFNQIADGTVSQTGIHHITYTTTTAKASLVAGEYGAILHRIEGNQVKDLRMGNANGKSFTISFRAVASQSTIISIAIRNAIPNRSYVVPISISTTASSYSITIPPDTTGTWATDISIGIDLWFTVACGSTYTTTTANTWLSGNFIAHNTTSNIFDTLNRSFSVTDVQLEAGTIATPFERRPYGTELALCQRYYKRFGAGVYPIVMSGTANAVCLQDTSQMRIAPTVSTNITDATYSTAPSGNQWGMVQAALGYATKTGTATITLYSFFPNAGVVFTVATWSVSPNAFQLTGNLYFDASAEL